MSNLIPAGTYEMVATRVAGDDGSPAVRWSRAGTKKTKQCLIYLEVVEGPFAGRVLPWFGYFTEDSHVRTTQALRYMGYKGDDLAALATQKLDQKVQGTIEHHEWDGKTHARVTWVNRPGGAAFIKLADPMSDVDVRQFAAQMRGRVQQVPEVDGERADVASNGNGSRGSAFAAQVVASEPEQQDGIPF